MIPVAAIMLWPVDIAPNNWRFCTGAELRRSEHAALFRTIGTKFGKGDGHSTFNLPNIEAPPGLRYIIRLS